MKSIVERLVVHFGTDEESPTIKRLAACVGHVSGGKTSILLMIGLHRQTNFHEVIRALSFPRNRPRAAVRDNQEANEQRSHCQEQEPAGSTMATGR